MKHLLHRTILLAILTQHAFSADAPKAVDPILWTPPTQAPNPVERFAPDAFKAELAKALPAIEKARKEFEPLPDTSLLVTYVEKNSLADIKEIHAGDFLLKLDGVLLTDPEQFSSRPEADQKLITFTPGYGESAIDIKPGKIGVRFRKWTKPRAPKFDLPEDPRWNAYVALAEKCYPMRLDLVETALFTAVKTGLPLDARLQSLLAQIALDDLRSSDAMAHAWYALKSPQLSSRAPTTFLNAALAGYKLDTALQAFRDYPALADERERIADLTRLVAAHKALSDAERIRVSPIAEAPSLFWDPIVPRAKTVPGARDNAERFITRLEEWHAFGFDAISRELQNFTFTPEVANIRIAFDFKFKETEVGEEFKALAIGVIDMNHERTGPHGPDINGMRWKNGETPSATGYIANQVSAVIRPGSARVYSWTPGLRFTASSTFGADTELEHHFEFVALKGRVEIALDGRTLFYGPLDLADPHLAVTLNCTGLTANLTHFSACELVEPREVEAKIKPKLNEKLRRQSTRLHNAGAELPLPMIDRLLELGADPNLRGQFEENAMHAALKYRSDKQEKDVVKRMLAKGGKLDLQLAVALGDRAKIDELIKADPKCINVTLPWSPLAPAIWYGDTETIKLLLDKGANINAPSPGISGRTPLITAVMQKQKGAFDLLLERGADVNLGDRNRNTALFFARDLKDKDMEAALLKRKAVVKAAADNSVPVKPPAPPTGDF